MKFIVNTPLPQTLPKECQKAARILRAFVDNRNQGLDGIIPRSVLEQAKGFAIFSVFKAGFVVSARAGSGVVVAKLPDGKWSAPSAIGTAGMGLGGQAGAEVTDFLVVLNSQARSFMSAGSLALGGNVSIALGPLGRNSEATSSLNTDGKLAMMYSYSQTRGLFGGVSVEGSVIVERQDANASAYGSPVTCKMLLGGAIPAPSWADELSRALETCTGLPGGRTWVADSLHRVEAQKYAFGSAAVRSPEPYSKKKQSSVLFPPAAWGKRKDSGSYFESRDNQDSPSTTNRRYSMFNKDKDANLSSKPNQERQSTWTGESLSKEDSIWFRPNQERQNTWSGESPSLSDVVIAKAVAQYDFQALQSGDLGFKKGDTIGIITKSDKVDDWWTGTVNGRKGIFPANFVTVV